MSKRSKSKRFIHQGKNAVELHAERFPYRSTLAEAEEKKITDPTLGGIE
ncbi:competence protein [Bacillus sp. FJAT-50079]|nr:competence protein [Bacillus sp. FJAT-50079]MBS4210650.1 competence protein [Bacillus sp. FJAT-50079]